MVAVPLHSVWRDVMPPVPASVLVVEDEPLVRLLAADLLGEAGLKVVEAANASEALTILKAGVEVHVLLADVDMPPGINGYELARAVHELWPGIEILITSGRAWPAAGDLPMGAAFLPKPVPNETLVSYVQAAAARARSLEVGASEDKYDEQSGAVVPFPRSA